MKPVSRYHLVTPHSMWGPGECNEIGRAGPLGTADLNVTGSAIDTLHGRHASQTLRSQSSLDVHDPLRLQLREYQQYSQGIRYESLPGSTLEYTADSYFLMTDDVISSKTGWGSDAGAWFATNAQYNTLERNAGANRAPGIALLTDSLNDAYTLQETRVDTKSTALFGQLTWHATPVLDLTAGLRVTHEDRSTEDEKTLSSAGSGAALNPVAVRGVRKALPATRHIPSRTGSASR